MRKLYPEYQDSGIPWLGQIPTHWEVKRLKWSLDSVVNGVWGDEPDGENDIACVRVADFDRQNFQVRIVEPTIRSVEPSQRARRELRPGDLLIEKSGGGEKQVVGAVVHYDHCLPAVSSNFVGRITTREDNVPRFWAYVHAMLYAGKLTYPAIKQTTGIQNLDTNAYFDTEVGFPPHDEQRVIAAFLDRETSRIDLLVAKHELLIERLAEYRNAVITRAVTRGLPPNAARDAGLDAQPRLKPSNIEWMGDIPEHWTKCRIHHQFAIVNGGTPNTNEEEYWDGEIIWVTPEDLGQNDEAFISESKRSITTVGAANSSAQVCPAGSIIVSTRAPIGHLAITAAATTTNQGCRTLVPRDDVDSTFAYCTLLASRGVIQSRGKGSTFMEISATDLKSHEIIVPPVAEQRAISQYLDQKTARIDALSKRAATAIERLNEYRTALITAAVTGKIDVRESGTAEEPTE